MAETLRLCIRASGWKRQEGLLACDSAAGVERDRYEKAVVTCKRRQRKRYVTLHIIAILDPMMVAVFRCHSAQPGVPRPIGW